jgi:opacity protein-like surface antigen
MIRRFVLHVAALCLLTAAAAHADEEAPLPSEEGKPWALGFGVGLVRSDDQGSLYLSGNVRRRIHFRARADDPQGGSATTEPDQGRHGRVYVEPEVGYWSRTSSAGLKDKDVLVGANLVGVVPTRVFDLFLGAGFGAHFLDLGVLQKGVVGTQSSTRFGANIQFGVEADVAHNVGLFGQGRVDLLDKNPSQQSKVWAGLRVRF